MKGEAMLLDNRQTDPIVEILRLAYRRGLALRQQPEEKRETAHSENIAEDADQAVEQHDFKERSFAEK